MQLPPVPDPLGLAGKAQHVEPLQVIVWVSYARPDYTGEEPPPDAKHWAALLDPGCTSVLAIRVDQTGYKRDELDGLLNSKDKWRKTWDAGGNQYRVPTLPGTLWLHSNVRGGPRFCRIPLDVWGIHCYYKVEWIKAGGSKTAVPAASGTMLVGPAIPLLGMRALWLARIELGLTWTANGGTASLSLP